MKTNKKFNVKTLSATILAMMVAFTLMLTVACTDSSANTSSSSSSSSSSSTTSITDYQVVTNGDFEFGTTEKAAADYPVATSVNWTRSNDSLLNSATSSNATSGIIDTAEETYKEIASAVAKKYSTVNYRFPVESGEGDTAVYFNPKTPEKLGYIGAEELYTYDKENSNTDKLPTSGTKVLMIHNVTSEEGRGTAQKFTSTKTFGVSSFGKLSVWVMTKNLKTKMDTEDFGAYVQLRSTIGSEISPVIVKNINTDGEWVQVNFYLNANDYADTSFRVVLGLGFGSKDVRQEYVEGFAYFDNVYYTDITREEYQTATSGDIDHTFDFYQLASKGSELVSAEKLVLSMDNSKTKGADEQYVAYDYSVNATVSTIVPTLDYFNGALNPATKVNDNYAHAAEVTGYGDSVVDFIGTYAEAQALTDSPIAAIDTPFKADDLTLLLYHPENASSSITFSMDIPDGYIASMSFYAKVETYLNITGLSVTYTDNMATNPKAASLISAFTTKNYENENYNDFVKVTLYATNTLGDNVARNVEVALTLGTTETVTDFNKLTKGYAVMTGFAFSTMTQEEFDKVETGTYTAIANLGADKPNGTDEAEEKDEYTFNYAATNETTIMNKFAGNVNGYTGVVGNHVMTNSNSEETRYAQDGTTAGIVNTKYLNNYGFTADEQTALNALEKEKNNKYLQPLVIKNTAALSYGYLSSAKTLSAGTTAFISVKVKALGNAKAYIYLVNADNLSGFPVMTISAKDYEYANDTLTVKETDKFSKQLFQTVEATADNEWTTVYFVLTAGENDLQYRVELWNGSRDAETTSEGTVIFDSAEITSSGSVTALLAKLGNPTASEDDTVSYVQMPTKVNYKDDNGKDATRYEWANEATDVYTYYAGAHAMVASYETIDVATERTEETETSSSSSEEESSSTLSYTGETNTALYVVSMVIAIVLVLVLIVVAVRLLFKKTRKEKVATEEFYSRNSREKAQEQAGRLR